MKNKDKITKRQREIIERRKKRNNRLALVIFGLIVLIAVAIFIGINAVRAIKGIFSNDKNTSEDPNIMATETIDESESKDIESNYSENPIVVESEDIRLGNSEQIDENGPISYIKNEFEDFEISDEDKKNILDSLPESLREMSVKYPETETTFLQYDKYKDNSEEVSIEKDLKDTERYTRKVKLPYFNQWDVRWGFREIAGNYFSVIGCGPTALSMVYTGLTGNTDKNPYEMGEYAYENGWFNDEGSLADLFITGAQSLGLQSNYIVASEDGIKNSINDGKIVLALVTNNGIGDFTHGGHYILMTELTEDGKVIILDPNSYINTNKEWDIQRILDQTQLTIEIWK